MPSDFYGYSTLPVLEINSGEWPRLSQTQLKSIFDYYAGPALQKMVGIGRRLTASRQKDENVALMAQVFYDEASIRRALSRLSAGGQQVLARLQHSGQFGIVGYQKLVQQMASRLSAGEVQAALSEVVMQGLALYGFTSLQSQGKLHFEALGRMHQLTEPGLSDREDLTVVLCTPSQILNEFKPSVQVLALIKSSQVEAYTGTQAPRLLQPARFELLLADVLAVLRYLEQNRVKILRDGGLSKRDYTRLNALLALKETDEALKTASRLSELTRLNFVWELVYASGLISHHLPTGLAEVNQAEVALFTALPRSRQALVLLDSWADSFYHDLLKIPEFRFPDPRPGTGHIPDWPEYKEARHDFIDLLYEVVEPHSKTTNDKNEAITSRPPQVGEGGWLELETLWAFIQEQQFDFLVSRRKWPRLRRDYYEGFGYVRTTGKEYVGIYNERKPKVKASKSKSYYFDPDGRYETLLLKADWELVEGVWISQVLSQALNWLGLTEVGRIGPDSATGSKLVFRFTPLGLAVFSDHPMVAETIPAIGGRETTASIATGSDLPPLIVQPNFELLILDPLNHLPLLRQLDSFATPVNNVNPSEGLGNVAQYKISRESALRAYRSGLTAEAILAILKSYSRVPISSNLEVSLADWQAELERLVLHPATTLLEVSDPVLLDRLQAEPELSEVIVRRYEPQVALVRATPEVIQKLLKRLEEWQVTTRQLVTSQEDKGAISFSDNYTIQVRRATPYLLYRLGQFCELANWQPGRQTATFRLSAESLSRSRVMLAGCNDAMGRYEAVVATLLRWLERGSTLSLETQLFLKGWLKLYHYQGSHFQTRKALVWKEPSSQGIEELLGWPPFRAAVLERPSPTVVILDEQVFEGIRPQLAELGFEFSQLEPKDQT